jgi:hypothetical protein
MGAPSVLLHAAGFPGAPQLPGTASPKLVKEFNEAVDRSTTSNDRAQYSQDASKSHPIILARRPPIPAHTPPQTLTCASPTAQQKARAFVDPVLRDVASGKTELAKNAKGPAVALSPSRNVMKITEPVSSFRHKSD